MSEPELQMGDQDFCVAADDENWYKAIANETLDSLGIETRVVEDRTMRFLVDGKVVEYDWSDHPSPWFVVLFDGHHEPKATNSVSVPDEIAFLTGK